MNHLTVVVVGSKLQILSIPWNNLWADNSQGMANIQIKLELGLRREEGLWKTLQSRDVIAIKSKNQI